ncbi:hypothetical protein MY11210_008540 [Beauveria gryllotalpidicola]
MAPTEIDFGNDEMLRVLYDNAQSLVEHATKEFWLYVFQKLAFPERNYLTSTEQPPVNYGTQRRVDIVIKMLQNGRLRVLIWKEDKEARAGQDIAELETQGFTAGCEHLDRGEPDREAFWVMTGYGTHSKLWAYSTADQDHLVPIWPYEGGIGERSNYLNLRGNERVFEWMFEFIKDNPLPSSDLITKCRNREVSGFLVDASCDTFVKVIEIRPGRDVNCQDVNGSAIRLGTSWYNSFVVIGNRREPCWHIVQNSELYWTFDLDPGH